MQSNNFSDNVTKKFKKTKKKTYLNSKNYSSSPKFEKKIKTISIKNKPIFTPKETYLVIKLKGEILSELSNCFFRIQLLLDKPNTTQENAHDPKEGRVVLGHLSGKLRRQVNRVGIGDIVSVEMSLYDTSRVRILAIIKN